MTTPVCPGCGAKFRHDATKLVCKDCGLPDEIVDLAIVVFFPELAEQPFAVRGDPLARLVFLVVEKERGELAERVARDGGRTPHGPSPR